MPLLPFEGAAESSQAAPDPSKARERESRRRQSRAAHGARRGPLHRSLTAAMQSLARVASRVGTLLRSQEGTLARTAQQTRGFAAGGCAGHAVSIEPPCSLQETCRRHLRRQRPCLRWAAARPSVQHFQRCQPCIAQHDARLHTLYASMQLACPLRPTGGHGHHDSVTHAGLTIHKAAKWHKYTGQAFAGLMWCVGVWMLGKAASGVAACCPGRCVAMTTV